MKKLGFCLLLVVLVFIGGILYYTHYYTKTPAYTVKIIEMAFNQRNGDELHKHVDIYSITEHYVERDLKNDPHVPKPVPAYKESLVVSAVSKMMTQAMDSYLLGGTYEVPPGNSNPMADKFINFMKHRQNYHLGKSITKDGNKGQKIVTYNFVDNSGTEKQIVLVFAPLPDGTWVLVDIPNLNDLSID